MRLVPLAVVLLSAAAAAAQDTEVEWSVSGGIANRFTRRAPFTFDDLTFAGPYRLCPPEADTPICVLGGLSDASYALEANYPVAILAGADVRRRLAGPAFLDLGLLGGLAVRERRVLRAQGQEVVRTRPEEPPELLGSFNSNSVFRSEGLGGFAYLHAGLRLDHEIGRGTPVGSRSALKRVFVEGGGGWIPMVPGGASAGLGRPPAVHGLFGIALRHGVTGAITLSVRYVRALKSADESLLLESKPHWLAFQAGWVSGH